MLLSRLLTLHRWRAVETLFGKSAPQLLDIFREALTHLVDKCGHLLISNVQASYISKRVNMDATAAHEKNQCLKNCAAFIYGTVIGIVQPGGHNL